MTVSSRARQSILAGIASLPVDVLGPTSAVALLTRGYRGRRRLQEQGWLAVAEWVGYLPLALELLNASLVAGAAEAEEVVAMAHGSWVQDSPGRIHRRRHPLRPEETTGSPGTPSP
jgi:hypothetical protein